MFQPLTGNGPPRQLGDCGVRLSPASTYKIPHALIALETGAVTLPRQDWVQAGEVVLSTDEKHAIGDRVEAGEVIDIAPRSMLVMRQL